MPLPAVEDLTQRGDGGGPAQRRRSGSAARRDRRAQPRASARDDRGPAGGPGDPGARAGGQPGPDAAATSGSRRIFGGVFDVKVTGQAFMPQNRNFLVIANHSPPPRHGAGEVVLGRAGRALASLAARDYFFDTPLKRAYFENFTNLIPMDRHGSLRESLRLAGEALQQGYQPAHLPRGHALARRASCCEFKPDAGLPRPDLRRGHPAPLPAGHLRGAAQGRHVAQADASSRCASAPRSESRSCAGAREGMARCESYRLVTRLAEEAVQRAARGEACSGSSPTWSSRRPRRVRARARGGGPG